MSVHERIERITGYTAEGSTESEIERLLFYMPVVAERATDPKVKQFATDMARRAKFRNLRPSPKQIAWMRQLVSDLFAQDGGDDAVIEI